MSDLQSYECVEPDGDCCLPLTISRSCGTGLEIVITVVGWPSSTTVTTSYTQTLSVATCIQSSDAVDLSLVDFHGTNFTPAKSRSHCLGMILATRLSHHEQRCGHCRQCRHR